PFLTPAIHLYLQYSPPAGAVALPRPATEESSSKATFLERFLSPTTAYILVACGSCIPLIPVSASVPALGVACLFLLCQAVVYILLMRHIQTGDEKPISFIFALEPTCLRVAAILTLALVIAPKQALSFVSLGMTAIAKAFLWVSFSILVSSSGTSHLWKLLTVFKCSRGHSISASTISTFGISTSQVQFQTSLLRAGGAGLGAVVALWQTFHSIIGLKFSRRIFIVFSLLPLLIFLYKPTISDHPLKWVAGMSDKLDTVSNHPVDELMKSAQQHYQKMVQGQSKTLKEAVREYKRRYNRSPPPNFDIWFEYARANGVILVDEYDVIMETLEPFWGIAPAEIRRRIQSAMKSGKNTKILSIKNHTANGVPNDDWLIEEIKSWLPETLAYLPDVDLILNSLDEPRVVVPRDMLDSIFQHRFTGASSSNVGEPSVSEVTPVHFADTNKQNVWSFATLSCPVDSPSRQPSLTHHSATHMHLHFVRNVTAAKDICSKPEYATTHGFFASPDSFLFTNTLVPIFSQSKLSSFQDILYPSPYYSEGYDLGRYVEEEDVNWEEKHNELYWAGSTTGGHSHEGNWRYQHRQRLVDFVNKKDQDIMLLNETRPGKWVTYHDVMGTMSQLFNVKFTAVLQCDAVDCIEQKAHFHVDDRVEMSQAYGSKFVLDLDGNSFSGRFYRLLGSKCAVLKQTIFREWHDDWIVPWVHYIPVSMGMTELPEIMRYLALTPAGQDRSKRIAEDGRAWAQRALRKEDMQSAFFRLLLEYGRLLNDDRDSLR
ncbi:hypothetical protein GP486_000745, partial [Trichoglossum hirsutum]